MSLDGSIFTHVYYPVSFRITPSEKVVSTPVYDRVWFLAKERAWILLESALVDTVRSRLQKELRR